MSRACRISRLQAVRRKGGDAVYGHGGYNKWADTNNLVVLYPQTESVGFNLDGCWDWWGLSDLLSRNRDFARKTGYQISAIKAMLDRLADQFVPSGGSSATFGTPQHFSVADSTSTSVALIWQPDSAAAGFNIYRSLSSAGPYTKINSDPVSGASFVDQGLSPNTTYHYEIRAIDGLSGLTSPLASSTPGATAPVPPECDPYFSDNVDHHIKGRAYPILLIKTYALGSNHLLGWYSRSHFSHLIKDGPSFYRVGYCS